MKTRKEIQTEMKRGAEIAAQLTTVGVPVRIRDAFSNEQTVTESLPWQLGHGEWVVRIKGKSGGWCCSMLAILP